MIRAWSFMKLRASVSCFFYKVDSIFTWSSFNSLACNSDICCFSSSCFSLRAIFSSSKLIFLSSVARLTLSFTSLCVWVTNSFKWTIYLAIASEDDFPPRAILTIITNVSTSTRATSRSEMPHKVLSSYPSINAFSSPPIRTLLCFVVLLTTTNLLWSNLYSLRGIASFSWPLEDSRVGMTGSTKAYVSTLRFGVSLGSWVSMLGLEVSLGWKPEGIFSPSSGSFGSGGAVSFLGAFCFLDESLTLNLSFSFSTTLFSLRSAVKHYLHHSNLSSSGSWPRTTMLSSGMCWAFIFPRAFLNVFLSSKKESSGYTPWWYYVAKPNFWKCEIMSPFGSCRWIGVGSHL